MKMNSTFPIQARSYGHRTPPWPKKPYEYKYSDEIDPPEPWQVEDLESLYQWL